MKYRNKSRNKMLLALPEGVKEILPNQIFESSQKLEYSFLECISDDKPKSIRVNTIKNRKNTNGGYSTSS